MVCTRCIMAVQQILTSLQLSGEVTMGEVDIKSSLSVNQLNKLDSNLQRIGFELLGTKESKAINTVKTELIALIQSGNVPFNFSLAGFVTNILHKSYGNFSQLFSVVEGITLEQFFLMQKVEKVKEWLRYGELQLSEMANLLGYSSTAHLSTQFKKITGSTPTAFKKATGGRISLDAV